jgi:hypothetical protein
LRQAKNLPHFFFRSCDAGRKQTAHQLVPALAVSLVLLDMLRLVAARLFENFSATHRSQLR